MNFNIPRVAALGLALAIAPIAAPSTMRHQPVETLATDPTQKPDRHFSKSKIFLKTRKLSWGLKPLSFREGCPMSDPRLWRSGLGLIGDRLGCLNNL
ncbi:MAG: hypothetical protein EA001_05970 [Oscillatoriales cyanobacterium]|nr:MAG: hypothetical protein EA001_05970 [Oscillatoriales cyanobacterium]